MAVEVAGTWELGWSAPLTEIEHWEMALRSFGVERFNVTPVSGIADKRFVHEYPSWAAMLEDRAHLVPVFVDERGEAELRSFDHPADALYIFGKANFAPFQTSLGQGHLSVRIDCSLPGMLWPHQAMSLVLYDRAGK